MEKFSSKVLKQILIAFTDIFIELPVGVSIGGIGGPNTTFISQLEGLNLTVCMHYLLLSSNPQVETALQGFFGTITTQNGNALGE